MATMAMMLNERFYVRAAPDAPDWGPFTWLEVEKAFAHPSVAKTTLVRPIHAAPESSRTLDVFVAERRASIRAANELEHRLDMERTRIATDARQNGRVATGATMLIAGLLLTLFSFAFIGGGGIVFVGLIAAGIKTLARS